MRTMKLWALAAGCGLAAFQSSAQVIPVDTFGPIGGNSSFFSIGAAATFGQNNGWTVTSGTLDVIGGYWQSPDGLQTLDMDGSNPGAIATTINVPTAGTVDISFYLAGNFFGNYTGTKYLNVQLGGATAQEFTVLNTGQTVNNMGWTLESASFYDPTPGPTVLSFASLDPGDSDSGPALGTVTASEVSSSSVPDGGASLMLLGLSGGGLIFLRRRVVLPA
jgi:hypothetical protein